MSPQLGKLIFLAGAAALAWVGISKLIPEGKKLLVVGGKKKPPAEEAAEDEPEAAPLPKKKRD
jgi:hypothetical protein